ncbi:MAG TPA: ATP-dependent sacrificial sulfur transferase LarE [Anaerolineaceae bacterium]
MIERAFLDGLELELSGKAERVMALFRENDAAVVAFSGGVDSSLLCVLGYLALGDRLLAVTVHSPVEAPGDSETAANVARECGFRHQVVEYDDLANPQFIANPPDRCYHCKLARFRAMQGIAADFGKEMGAARVIVAEGSNTDDAADYRPGTRAVAELGIRSLLAEAGLTKPEIRALAQALNLSVWDRPSAPCLATRFPYGTPVTRNGLMQVAHGEEYLRSLGFQPARVRHYGQTARLEVAPEMLERLIELRSEVLMRFKSMGFTYIVVDMAGYRTGSMNEVLER